LDRLTLEDGLRSFLNEFTKALLYFHDTGELPKEETSGPVDRVDQLSMPRTGKSLHTGH